MIIMYKVRMYQFSPLSNAYRPLRSWEIEESLYTANVYALSLIDSVFEFYKYELYDQGGKWLRCFWSIDNNLFQP